MKQIIEIILDIWFISIPLIIFLIFYFVELTLRIFDYIINIRVINKIENKILNQNNNLDNFISQFLLDNVKEDLLDKSSNNSKDNFDIAAFKKIFKIS